MGHDKSEIANYNLPEDVIIITKGSSKGAQVKYRYENYWYKKNRWGYEGLSEVLVSEVLKCSNYSNFVEYERCKVNGTDGCRSRNFLKSNESIITLSRLYSITKGEELSSYIRRLDNYKDRIDFTLDFVYSTTRLDIKSYLSSILLLDMLTLNDDRHLNNLSIILDGDSGEYSIAPIYDNGAALLSNYGEYPIDETLETNISKVIAQPFSVNFEAQALYLPSILQLDYPALYNALDNYTDSRAKQVLLFQLIKYRDLFCKKE